MRIYKLIVLVIFFCLVKAKGFSQTTLEPGFELLEFYKIAEVYNSSQNISIKMTYLYTDSVHVDSVLEYLSGSYKLNNGRYYGMIDSVEFIQGDLYNVTVYNEDSLVVVNDRTPLNITQVPALDSLYRAANLDSMTATNINDSTRRLNLYFNNDLYDYKSYQMFYDSRTYLIDSVTIFVRQTPDSAQGLSETGIITISMTNSLTYPIDPSDYDESRVVYKSGSTFYLKPAYTGYTLLVNTAN